MLPRIEASLHELRKSERRVADYVLANPNAVVNSTIIELSEAAGVSQPTVARFCQAVGTSGFKEFRLRLAQSLAAGVPFVHSDVNQGDAMSEIGSKVFDRAILDLINVRNQLDPQAIQLATKILANANRIEFYGLGNSGIVAADAQHKFFRLNVPTIAYSDPHIHGMAATMLHPGDVVVAISSSGRTLDLLRSVDLALAAGADVIGITASASPLSQACTVSLCADVAEDPDIYTPMTSRLVHLTIIDTLAVGVALARGPELVAQLERTKRTLQDKRVRGYVE